MERASHLLNLDSLIERLPAFQKVMERCMVTMSKPYASAREISTWIESDSALSGKVLGMANSPYYGQTDKVMRTERAVVLLGRRALEDVFYSFYIQGLFSAQGGSEVAGLWTSALSAGICAKELTYVLGLPSSEGMETPDAGAYLTGLLHDAGKLLVLTHYPEAYHAAESLRAKEGVSEIEAEQRLWGFDHAQLGRSMAEKWSLPLSVCDAIGRHHDPMLGAPAALDALVRLSDLLCQAEGPMGEMEAARGLEPAFREVLGLGEQHLLLMEKVMGTVREKMLVYDGMMDTGTWQTV
jgi:HD-like signal output (HDOD) protein